MGATVFVQPLDLVKNRMQLSGKEAPDMFWFWFYLTACRIITLFLPLGEGGATRQHKTSLHAIVRVIREEGFFGIYNGYVTNLKVVNV